ncbi:VacJ family lipoprotein [Undibacterium sp. CY18W]|uniref:VacJ family lipoprotein n=1 Tax=Undibacterium hunanense TaxID=2762292 RepID=A0ABR6ZRD8_9BURK|nr:VacJ family lipoprotein [Undibacterium hunanense]MBC3918440.1 VacJ family lipoprotein [Undibacterium hunanense]
MKSQSPFPAFSGLRRLLPLLLLLTSIVLTGCSTVTVEKIKDKADQTLDVLSTKTNIGKNPRDPLEGFNRAMFSFNDTIDQAIVKPVAEGYRAALPTFVQTGVGNFFSNIGDVWNAVNNILQGRVNDGVTDVMRFAVNTTIGIGGLLDIGSAAGMPKHNEDFGQTLGKWGVKSGPYLVLPVLGPSTVRDALATPVDMKGDLWTYKRPVYVKNIGTVLRLVDKRASVLDAGSLLEEAALDKYVFFRDAYLQRRAGQVNPEDD